MSYILRLSNQKVRELWSTVQENMPTNIFNFMIKYLKNTLTVKTTFKNGLIPILLRALSALIQKRFLRMADTTGITTLCFSFFAKLLVIC